MTHSLRFVFALLALLLLPTTAATAQIYVDTDATGANDGSSWTDAYTDLQAALSNATSSDEIWIAEGVYTPDPDGTDSIQSFTITGNQDGLGLYGGFDGSESSRSQRDPAAHVTVLSGDIDGDDDTNADGVTETTDDVNGTNSRTVVLVKGGDSISPDVAANVTEATVLSGVTVTAGELGTQNSGGGLYCDGTGSGNACSPTITNVVFAGNRSDDQGRGGALYNNGSDGGASSPTITNVVFSGNRSPFGEGGALYNNGESGGVSSPTITNVVFSGNGDDSGSGGAIYNFGDSGTAAPRITNAVFVENSAHTGGAIYNDGDGGTAAPTITNATFTGNSATTDGGAIDNIEAAPQIDNTVVWNNTSYGTRTSGQIHNLGDSATPTLSHTIVEGGGGGISENQGSSTTFLDDGGRSVPFANSTNLDRAPAFAGGSSLAGPDGALGTADDSLALVSTSPAVDAGDNAALPPDVADLDGDGNTGELLPEDLTGAARTQDQTGNGTATVNLGAYELVQTRPPLATTEAADSVGATTTDLGGTVNPALSETTVQFEYRPTGASSFSSVTAAESPLTGATDQPVTASPSGLSPDTEYEVRVVATNAEGTTEGSLKTFTTQSQTPPSATTGAVENVGGASADLTGTVNPGGLETTVQAQVFPTARPGDVITVEDASIPVSGTFDVSIRVSLGGLQPDTEYKARLVASNSKGGARGALGTFTTAASASPTATTEAPSSVGTTTVDLAGTITPGGTATDVTFEYREVGAASFTSATAPESPLIGTADQSVSATVTGLQPGTDYEGKVIASNSEGTDEGSLKTFTTAAVGVAITGGGFGALDQTFSPPMGQANQPIGVVRLTPGQSGAALTEVSVTPNTPGVRGVDRVGLWISGDDQFDASGDTELASLDLDPQTDLPSPMTFDGFTEALSGQARTLFVTVTLTDAAAGKVTGFLQNETALALDGGAITEVNGNGQSGFSNLPLSSDASALPVEMAGFDGTTTDNGVRLRWQTASEKNNVGFRVERREAGGEGRGGAWMEVGFVEGSGTTSDVRRYRFTDADLPYAADSVSYRLRQVDTDGSTHLTDPVTIARSGPDELKLLGTAPNPARQRATVRYGVPESVDGTVHLRLYDVMGRRVRSVRVETEAGRHERALDVGGLSSGMYVLRLSAGGQSVTRKLTVVQ